MEQLRTDREISKIFGENLRVLSAKEQSISQLCRNLQINRTQFNRYLSGEASPRPLILNRICIYFGVDSRILLEPISRIKYLPREKFAGVFRDTVLRKLDFDFDDQILPDGFVRFFRPSFLKPGKYICNFATIKTRLGAKVFEGTEPPIFQLNDKYSAKAVQFRFSGVFFKHVEGFSMLCNFGRGQNLNYSYLMPGFRGRGNTLYGYSVVSRPPTQLSQVRCPLIIEYLKPDCSTVLAAARARGIHDIDAVPEEFLTYLQS